MFTGIVEQIGEVKESQTLDKSSTGGNGASLTIAGAASILGDCHLGDSIAINGTCLTVTAFDKDSFKVGVSDETLRKTNLGFLKAGDKVNLERAISGDVRFGGHMVQGHVDTIAEIVERHPDGNSIAFQFKLRDREFINYIVHKGFICVDGTSLTVTGVDYENATFTIMMIAYTQSKVVLPTRKLGDWVNIEVDLTGKLIARQVELQLGSQAENKESMLYKLVSRIVDDKLARKI
ncbi:DEKNAAC102706 [Brettanomyces naardenensis]|uniref:Riboflavin synthase n=1 Tax=Brettanomyces naardenensis TaxID=13370 RepID=A0A448YKD0_BRENA|nr:DEKNAAC102706 [Brettanomyces naardenensis]